MRWPWVAVGISVGACGSGLAAFEWWEWSLGSSCSGAPCVGLLPVWLNPLFYGGVVSGALGFAMALDAAQLPAPTRVRDPNPRPSTGRSNR